MVSPHSLPAKILLVDDDARNLEVLESLLHSPGCELVRALTADQALLRLITDEFAVIVLDIQMPGMSGLELAGLIKQRQRTRHIPIIFLTAYFQEDKDVLEGYGSGAVDYLTKPINPQILRSKIAVFVDLYQKTRALAEANRALEQENAQRLKAEEELRHVNGELEMRVSDRTAALSRANDELRAREAALRASEAQARAASRAKDDFLAALSHELRTPLNPVLLLASEAVNNRGLSPAVRSDFDLIRQNVELEARLIDDLLDLTSITHGKLPLESRAVDLHAILQNALAIVRPEVTAKGLQLNTELHATDCIVWGDEVRLQQVCWNVLKNAVKFTPREGKILLETRLAPDRDEITLSVADTGIGLTAVELDGIFEAFVQGEHSGEDSLHRFGGLGLGLAISRMLVEMHSGQILASSRGRGQGATFTITLPLARTTLPNPAGPASRPEAPGKAPTLRGGQRIRILLVDDHAPTRATLAQLLGRRDYDVTTAGSVLEARAAAARRQFDILISDIGLPDGSGCELLHDLKASQPGLAGVAVSGYGIEDDIARSRQAGFSQHMVKPVTIDTLNAAILAALDNHAVAEHPTE